MNHKNHTMVITSENKPGVLYRISDVFLRRKINIESLIVDKIPLTGLSRFTIVIQQNSEVVTKIVKQLQKIIEVTEVIAKEEIKIDAIEKVSGIQYMELLAEKEKGAISLAQGIPYFTTPEHIKEAAIKAIKENLVGKYGSRYGITPLREAAAAKLQKDNNMQVSPSQIIITHGAIEASIVSMIALLQPQDEVIMLTPGYALHLTQIKITEHGRAPVCVSQLEKIEEAITPNTKAILFSNPCNPTGKVFSKKELQFIADIALKYNLYIISDEIYEYFTFDNKKHISIGSFPEVADKTISIFGVSKAYAMTGWRIGYLVANEKLISQISDVHEHLVVCPTVVSQYAALAAITGSQQIVQEYNSIFAKHREIVSNELGQTNNIEFQKPDGSYFAFFKIKNCEDDVALAQELVKKAKVAVVPGSAFGPGGEGYLRISFGCEEGVLREGLKRLRDYFNE